MFLEGDRIQIKPGSFPHSNSYLSGRKGTVIEYGGFYSTPKIGRHRLVRTRIEGESKVVIVGENDIHSIEITTRG